MKRILFSAFSAVVAIGLVAGAANAQRRITPFFGGGLATGTGDLGDDTESGWVVFAGVDVPLGLDPGLTVGLTASYARVPYSGGFDEFTGVPALFGELGYVVGAQSPRMIKPYLRAGAGVQLRKYDPGSTGYRTRSDGGLAFSAGGGLQFHLSPATLFVGAHYVTDADAGVLAFHGGLAFPARAAK
jgi:opacity protein-like surface antigen